MLMPELMVLHHTAGDARLLRNLRPKAIGVRVLAALAGHRSIQTTQRYIDVNDKMMRNAVELI